MNIAFLTEGNYAGKVPRTNANRTDGAWICALNATHHYIYDKNIPNYDLGIFIIPKRCDENFDIRLWTNWFDENLRHKFGKIAVMQEGPNDGWLDWTLECQTAYMNFIAGQCDLIFCHNEIDKNYYAGFFTGKQVEILPTLLIEDSINQSSLRRPENRSGVMIGGNMCQWYGGMDSLNIAMQIGGEIYVPSMGRKQDGEEAIIGLTHLSYMNWTNWMTELSKRKYAVHLMRTYAAGTFNLNCAHLGIPCIGYNQCDSQRICFPELSVNEGDLLEARRIAKHLAENDQFYNHVSLYAKKAWKDNYSEEIFLKKFNGYFEN